MIEGAIAEPPFLVSVSVISNQSWTFSILLPDRDSGPTIATVDTLVTWKYTDIWIVL